MFFRDYKSKIVKGIDEDDLLEGNLNKILNSKQLYMYHMDHTFMQYQCRYFHKIRIHTHLLNNVV